MLVTDKPEDLASTNALDDVEDPSRAVETPPAYLSFGMTPCAIENPPADGDLVYFMVRARCTGEHGPVTRTDGEKRYKRDLKIQAIWRPGEDEPEQEPEPEKKSRKTKAQEDAEAEAAAADDQPPLFDDDGTEDLGDDVDDGDGDGDPGDDESDNVVPFNGGPAFSDNDSEG